MLTRHLLFLALTGFILLPAGTAPAADAIRTVGSSTVYPFITVAAEKFGNKTDFPTPIVEPLGTGGGFEKFCEGVGEDYPDISNASRPVKASEKKRCQENGVTDMTEIKLGYDGIVIVNNLDAEDFSLTREHLFKALAYKLPKDGKLVPNWYQKWSEIDPALPDQKIEVYGPPPTSGTRDAFVELAFEPACTKMEAFKTAYPDKKARKSACHLIREDGPYIVASEKDTLIIQKISTNPNALGILGYSYLDQFSGEIKGAKVEDAAPTFENIADGNYPLSRSLFIYVKDAHIGKTPGLGEFLQELVSEEASGEEGYLSFRGLVPLTEEERQQQVEKVEQLISAD